MKNARVNGPGDTRVIGLASGRDYSIALSASTTCSGVARFL